MQKLQVSWKEYGEYLQDLAYNIKISGKHYESVLGIPRGGYPVAVYLSHALDIPITGDIIWAISKKSHGRVLICDDVVDTGETWGGLKRAGAMDIACVFTKSCTPPDLFPTYFAALAGREDWVVFPYEREGEDVV